jgi:hypothetical protein
LRINDRYKVNIVKGKVWDTYSNTEERGWIHRGYRYIKVDGKSQLVHRIIYQAAQNIKLTPKEQIDHIDNNKLNNSIFNLRRVNNSINSQNKPYARSDSKTGVKGVSKTIGGKFIARCMGKHIGCYNTAEEASKDYWEYAFTLNRKHGTKLAIPKEEYERLNEHYSKFDKPNSNFLPDPKPHPNPIPNPIIIPKGQKKRGIEIIVISDEDEEIVDLTKE